MRSLTPWSLACKHVANGAVSQPAIAAGRHVSQVFKSMLTEKSPAPPATANKPLVLVVDDEYGPRESIAFTLSSEFTVETAERAAEALAKLRAKSFSVIVLDIRMPEMDGIRALEEIRKIDPLVSVVMLTGYGTLLTAQQAIVAGANQYLRKPPDIAELIDAVRKQTDATRVRRRIRVRH